LLENGFGSHRIEGIGDKHVPWIHNVANTDFISAIDDQAVIQVARLFNEKNGKKFLASKGIAEEFIEKLDLLGFSGIANLLSAIKFAKYYELDNHDIILTVLTDSMELYQSRLQEITLESGEYQEVTAVSDYERYLAGTTPDNFLELTYKDRKRIHNLKYFTWVEQQGKSYEEIMAQWYDKDYWKGIQSQVSEIDELIKEFNAEVGLDS
jgi:hypothetical protein